MLDVLIGVNSLSIYYLNTATNKKAIEIMSFNNELKVNKSNCFIFRIINATLLKFKHWNH
jgi:hypothetical protein